MPHTAYLCTQLFLERTSHARRNTQRPGCWSHTPPPSPLQSAIHHCATGERDGERSEDGRKKNWEGERVKEQKRDKGRSDHVCLFTSSWASLNPCRGHTHAHTHIHTCKRHQTLYVKPESLKATTSSKGSSSVCVCMYMWRGAPEAIWNCVRSGTWIKMQKTHRLTQSCRTTQTHK